MNEQALQKLVEDISLKYFNRRFSHKAHWNSRLQTTGGRYKLRTHDLDFNPKIYQLYGQEELEKVIKHELCHYHLHILGLGFQHKDRDFKVLLEKVGGARYAPKMVERKKLSYSCKNCGQIYQRARKINTKKYSCGKCRGKLFPVQ